MLTASCVVDMGKDNPEFSVDDQKVTFDLFDAAKHSIDRNVYSKVKENENEIAQMARSKIAQDP